MMFATHMHFHHINKHTQKPPEEGRCSSKQHALILSVQWLLLLACCCSRQSDATGQSWPILHRSRPPSNSYGCPYALCSAWQSEAVFAACFSLKVVSIFPYLTLAVVVLWAVKPKTVRGAGCLATLCRTVWPDERCASPYCCAAQVFKFQARLCPKLT